MHVTNVRIPALIALAVATLGLWGIYRTTVFEQTPEKLPFMFPVTVGDLNALPIFVFSTTRPYNRCVRQIMRLHPRAKITVVDVEQAGKFVNQHCPRIYTTYRNIIAISYKSDIFRYCALYTHGGVYIDDDLWLHGEITQFNKVPGALLILQDGVRLTFLRRGDDTYGVLTGLIVARHKEIYAFGCSMELLIARVATNMVHVKTNKPKLAVTGPALLGECVRPGSDATIIGKGGGPMSFGFLWSGKKLFTHVSVERLDTPHYSKLDRLAN